MEILLILFLIPVALVAVIYALLGVGFVVLSIVVCTSLIIANWKENV